MQQKWDRRDAKLKKRRFGMHVSGAGLRSNTQNAIAKHAKEAGMRDLEKALVVKSLLSKADMSPAPGTDFEEKYQAKPNTDPDDVPRQQLHCEECGKQYGEGEKLQHGDALRVKQGVCSSPTCKESAYMYGRSPKKTQDWG